jgi:MFS family permease
MDSRSLESPSIGRDAILLIVGSFFVFAGIGITNFILPFYFISLNVSLSSVGFIFAFTPLVFGVLRYVFGSLGDIFSRKKLLWMGSLIQMGNVFLYPWVRGVPAFTGLSISQGFSKSLRSGSITPLMIICTPPQKKGTALALTMSSYASGLALGYTIAGFLLPVLSYLGTLNLAGANLFLGFLCFLFVQAKCDVKKKTTSLKETFSVKGFSRNTLILLLAFLVSGVAAALGEGFALPLYLEQEFLVPSELNGLIIAISWLLQSIPGFIAPGLNDKFNPLWLTGVMSLLCGICFLGIYLSSTLSWFIGLFFLYNVFVAFVFNNRWVIVGDASRKSSTGKDVAIPSVGYGVGAFIGSNIAGVLADLWGYQILYGLEGVFWIFHGLLIIFLLVGYPSLRQFRLSPKSNSTAD